MLPVLGLMVPAQVLATWQDEIGYTQLGRELGAALPKGAGVSVSLVEATLTAEGGEYLPTVETAPATGNFAGKSFVFRSGVSQVSFHAARAGSFFFGSNTNPLAGDASVAPLAGSAPTAGVDCYQADGWLGADFLRLGSPQLPQVEGQLIGNHSWIGMVGFDFSATEANEALQRLDWSVHASNHVAVVGLNNGAATVVPPLLGSAYNVLSVGRTDGLHSTGTTRAQVDGPGRVKPELVAPMTTTSWATAVVSSCAAMLAEAGRAVSPQAQKSEVLRAVMLAGARKDPFPAWSNTTTRPLDAHFGAGEVNLWRSYRTLVAGEAGDGAPAPVSRSGWHFASAIAAGQERAYSVRVPDGCLARELSVAVVWNRAVATNPSTHWINPAPVLANLDLMVISVPDTGPTAEVSRSHSGADGSTAHPLEHVFLRDLAAGTYRLGVRNAIGSPAAAYGLAWFLSLAPAAAPEAAFQWSADAPSITLVFSRLGVGLTYALQTSDDLLSWQTQQTLMAEATSATIAVAGTPARAFYRLVWVP